MHYTRYDDDFRDNFIGYIRRKTKRISKNKQKNLHSSNSDATFQFAITY